MSVVVVFKDEWGRVGRRPDCILHLWTPLDFVQVLQRHCCAVLDTLKTDACLSFGHTSYSCLITSSSHANGRIHFLLMLENQTWFDTALHFIASCVKFRFTIKGGRTWQFPISMFSRKGRGNITEWFFEKVNRNNALIWSFLKTCNQC